jgi:3'-phosphoadenosine 5'-phosphosulfate sulfotransferase (PAPS reductase)/FAD synthetase
MIESQDFFARLEQTSDKISIVVPISGGKDSQACMKLAVSTESGSKVIGLFCDTQFEHPETYRHLLKIEELYGVPIIRVCNGSVPDLVVQYRRFPSGGARFCTDRLKIIPSKMFYKGLAEVNGGFEVWYGMRSDESREREKRYTNKVSDETYAPHEVLQSYPKHLAKLGVRFKLPVLDWSLEEVFSFLNGEANPLYKGGAKRVGCFPCLASSNGSMISAFTYDEFGAQQLALVKHLEEIIDKNLMDTKEYSNTDEQPDFQGCSICAM